MVEPIVGKPEEMAAAIAKALEAIEEYHDARHSWHMDTFDRAEYAELALGQIEEALENYTEE